MNPLVPEPPAVAMTSPLSAAPEMPSPRPGLGALVALLAASGKTKFIPVDYDPFEAVKVDHDPFAKGGSA